MPQERLSMCKIRDVLRLKAGGSTTPTPSDARRPARADVKRSQGRLAAESEAMTGSRGLGNVAAETDCVAGVVGFELRCAERKFISLRCRVSSDSGTPAETAAVPRENDLLRWGCSPRLPSRPHCEPHTERSPHLTSKFESSHPGRSDTNFDGREWIQQLLSCTSVQCLRRSNQPEDCSLSARLPEQTERQWW